MKKFFLHLFTALILPIGGFSQSEKDQKTSIRSSNYSNSTISPNRSEINDKIIIKQDSYRNQYQPRTQPIIYNDPWVWNRWNRWGAPFYGYSYFDTWYYNDLYGRRIPTRTYFYPNGKRDTIYGKPTSFRIGLNYSTKNELGGWITIGNKNFFYLELNGVSSNDKSTFYSDPRVNFVQSTQIWKDERHNDLSKGSSFYFGVGTVIKNTKPFISLGWVKEKKYYQFYDETLILSNNGFYSFENYSKSFLSAKLGVIQDFNKLSVKGDFNPFQNTFTFGIAFNF